jgi:hypothetical protein
MLSLLGAFHLTCLLLVLNIAETAPTTEMKAQLKFEVP